MLSVFKVASAASTVSMTTFVIVLVCAVLAAAVIAWICAIIYRKKIYESKIGAAEVRSR